MQLNSKIDQLSAVECFLSQILDEDCIYLSSIDCDTSSIYAEETGHEEILIDKFSLTKISLEFYVEKHYPCAKEICISGSC